MMRRRALFSLLAPLALFATTANAAGTELNWATRLSEYVIVDQDLHSVLTEISDHLGVPAHVSDALTGRVHEKLPSSTAKELVTKLANRYGFTWYFDGSGLYFSSLKENASQMIPIGQVSFSYLQRELGDLSILDPRFELKYSDAGHVVYASGPPRYVELVRQGLEVANSQTVERQETKGVNVIYGYGGTHTNP
jgi:type III secretion protein C